MSFTISFFCIWKDDKVDFDLLTGIIQKHHENSKKSNPQTKMFRRSPKSRLPHHQLDPITNPITNQRLKPVI